MKREGNRTYGFTLVETMIAMLILAVLALGGGAILYQAGKTVAIQNNKRVAVEAACQRLEQLCEKAYNNIKPPVFNSQYYVDDDFLLSTDNPDAEVSINGIMLPIVTTVERIGSSNFNGYEYVRAIVRMQYRLGGDDWISVATNLR